MGVSVLASLSACGSLQDDKFVYVGHPDAYPSYQLYYDKTKDMFMLIDKRHGCYEKTQSGTCLAMTAEETEQFRNEVLTRMMSIDKKLAADDYGSKAIPELEKAGISTIKKPITIPGEGIQATAIKQIVVDRKKEYHLVRGEKTIEADLIATVIPSGSGKDIKVIYTIDFPSVNKETDLQPYVVDPEYLYNHMTKEAVTEAQNNQTEVMGNHKQVQTKVDDYLKDVVDTDNQDSSTK